MFDFDILALGILHRVLKQPVEAEALAGRSPLRAPDCWCVEWSASTSAPCYNATLSACFFETAERMRNCLHWNGQLWDFSRSSSTISPFQKDFGMQIILGDSCGNMYSETPSAVAFGLGLRIAVYPEQAATYALHKATRDSDMWPIHCWCKLWIRKAVSSLRSCSNVQDSYAPQDNDPATGATRRLTILAYFNEPWRTWSSKSEWTSVDQFVPQNKLKKAMKIWGSAWWSLDSEDWHPGYGGELRIHESAGQRPDPRHFQALEPKAGTVVIFDSRKVWQLGSTF